MKDFNEIWFVQASALLLKERMGRVQRHDKNYLKKVDDCSSSGRVL